MLGAVYDRRGRLLGDSERAKSNRAWSGNPSRLPEGLGEDADRLPGRTFFGGHLRDAFGHLLLEVMPRFWPDLAYQEFDHVLLCSTVVGRASGPIQPYAADLLAGLGVDPASCVRLADRPLVCEELTVATAPFVLKHAVHPAFLQPFERACGSLVGEGTGTASSMTGRRLYFSRGRLPASRRRAANEAELEAILVGAGFDVIHPQEMPIRDQVAAVDGADALAGCDGSALHLAAFARPGTVLLAIDSRPVLNQFMIDGVRGVDAVHVLAAAQRTDRTGRWVADLDLVRQGLAAAALA